MYDLIVIGGGPAGLTAMLFALRKNLNALMITEDVGGKTKRHLSIPGADLHYLISGIEIIDRFRRELEYQNFPHQLDRGVSLTATDDYFTITTGQQLQLAAKSVIVATGSQIKQLDVPGEQQFTGRGVSYSAISYAPMFVGKQAAVIGNGMQALRAVAELSQLAATVHLISPVAGAFNSAMAQKLITNHNRVIVFEHHQVKAIEGETYANRLLLETPDGDEVEIPTDGIFIELGLLPNSALVSHLVNVDDQHRIIINHRNQTSHPGLFAAGDVTNTYAEQVLVAIGEGAKAALSAYEYLMGLL